MTELKKIQKSVLELTPEITVSEKNGCVQLSGEVADWKLAVKAGKIAAHRKGFLGVLNDVTLKGFTQKQKPFAVVDSLYDGQAPDVLIIGGGIVGCAAARELTRFKLNVWLVERGSDVALGGSSRNGGAVHVGVNYSPSSQKHIYNFAGNTMYDTLAKELDVPFERTGHLMLIANRWEKILVDFLKLNSKRLKIPGVRFVNRQELLEIEPFAPSWAYGGLYMPTGGVTSPYKMTVAMAENAVVNGAKICLDTAVVGMTVDNGKISAVQTNRGTLYPKTVVNAAGIYSDVIADMAGDRTFTIHPRKGTDIILDKKVGHLINTCIVKSPITVIPDKNVREKQSFGERLKSVKFALSSDNHTKGIAVIHTVDKNMIIGPNILETPDREDNTTDAATMSHIIAEQQRVAEGIKPSDVIAYFSGVRAPTYEEDFCVRRGIFTENIFEAAGIQSPGVTAAPAIAKDLAKWTVEYLEKTTSVAVNPDYNPIRIAPPKLKDLPEEERDALIKQNPDYGQIVCRCEEISKGEILDVLNSPLPVFSLDAVKRRCRPGMGRCQGGFCSPQLVKILAEAASVNLEDVKKSGANSNILLNKTKSSC